MMLKFRRQIVDTMIKFNFVAYSLEDDEKHYHKCEQGIC
jgi:hypothetical protein